MLISIASYLAHCSYSMKNAQSASHFIFALSSLFRSGKIALVSIHSWFEHVDAPIQRLGFASDPTDEAISSLYAIHPFDSIADHYCALTDILIS